MELTKDVKDLFRIVRTKLGAPIRPIQLDDNQLCDLLEVCVGDYAERVQNWVVQSQWATLYGKDINATDIAYALSLRTLDFTKDYSYWFSKEVGLQQRGPWELKKDFFEIERGKQSYLVPAGREINKVLYVTPSTTKAALYGNFGGLDGGFAGGLGQYGNMGNGMGMMGFYVGSAYDVTLLASDLKYKNSLLRGDLAYKVTAGPEGTHIIHLMSVPGSTNTFQGMAVDDSMGWNKYANHYCWYTYYDVNPEDVDECRMKNTDILITPDQVPLDKLKYEFLNEATKNIIRQLLTAESMITLGMIRGTFSGKVSIPRAELSMDYSMFLELGKAEKEKTLEKLDKRLEEMLPWNVMEQQAKMTNSLNEVLKAKPLPFYVR